MTNLCSLCFSTHNGYFRVVTWSISKKDATSTFVLSKCFDSCLGNTRKKKSNCYGKVLRLFASSMPWAIRLFQPATIIQNTCCGYSGVFLIIARWRNERAREVTQQAWLGRELNGSNLTQCWFTVSRKTQLERHCPHQNHPWSVFPFHALCPEWIELRFPSTPVPMQKQNLLKLHISRKCSRGQK